MAPKIEKESIFIMFVLLLVETVPWSMLSIVGSCGVAVPSIDGVK